MSQFVEWCRSNKIDGYCIVGAMRRRCFSVGKTTGRATPAPWLPLWGSWRANSETERAFAVANMKKCGDCGWVPSQSRLRRASSPIGRAKGRLRRPAIYHTFPNRVTPNGVGLLPESQARHSPRVLSRPLSHGFQPCQLSHRESQGAATPPSYLPPAIEPGDPQRCGSTARVPGSS